MPFQGMAVSAAHFMPDTQESMAWRWSLIEQALFVVEQALLQNFPSA